MIFAFAFFLSAGKVTVIAPVCFPTLLVSTGVFSSILTPSFGLVIAWVKSAFSPGLTVNSLISGVYAVRSGRDTTSTFAPSGRLSMAPLISSSLSDFAVLTVGSVGASPFKTYQNPSFSPLLG